MPQSTTDKQYEGVINECKDTFFKKMKDYGTSWRVFRPISVADQLYIKAKRIRNIQDGMIPEVKEGKNDEFKAIINYSIIGLMQLSIKHDNWDLTKEELLPLYEEQVAHAQRLMNDKNHDYGEAWRDLDIKSITDLIITKILRIRQIIRNDGKTLVSEGVEGNYYDILNYAVFAIILGEGVK